MDYQWEHFDNSLLIKNSKKPEILSFSNFSRLIKVSTLSVLFYLGRYRDISFKTT